MRSRTYSVSRACGFSQDEREGRARPRVLFVGPSGSNKTMAAYASPRPSSARKGRRSARRAVRRLRACGRIMRKKHPDVHYYAPAGVNGYLVEQVRGSSPTRRLPPIMAGKKVYILDRVDLLGTAANAFLKTLEEPPADVVLILLGRTRESVLPTILSRCQVVEFRHIPRRRPRDRPSEHGGADRAGAHGHQACGGSITRAIEFLRSSGNERLAFRGRVLQVMASLPRADDWDVLCWARELVEKAKAPLDDVIAEQEAELAENADFLQKSAIRQIEARNKRQIGAKTTEFLRQTHAIMGSWLRDVLVVLRGSARLVINVDAREDIEVAAAQTDEARLYEGPARRRPR